MVSLRIADVNFEIHIPDIPNDGAPEDLHQVLSTAARANRWLWERTPAQVVVRLCDTEEAFKQHCGDYYSPVAVGCATRDGQLVSRTPGGGLPNPLRFPAVTRHEMCHSFWILLLGEALQKADPGNSEAVWNAYWLCEALAGWVGNDPFLLSREACQGLSEMGVLSSADLHFRYDGNRYKGEDGEISPDKIKQFYGLWTAFLVWLTNGNPLSIRSLLMDWAEDATEENFERLFEATFGASLATKAGEFLKPNWQ